MWGSVDARSQTTKRFLETFHPPHRYRYVVVTWLARLNPFAPIEPMKEATVAAERNHLVANFETLRIREDRGNFQDWNSSYEIHPPQRNFESLPGGEIARRRKGLGFHQRCSKI